MHKLSRALKTRYIKTWCPQCHYICRVSRKNLANGAPICPVHLVPMRVQRYRGGPQNDTSIVDRVLEEMRQDKEAKMAEWRSKWNLEVAARKRQEELSRQEAQAKSAAEWADWCARNRYVPKTAAEMFVDPYEEDRKRRAQHEAEMKEIMAQVERSKQEAHEAYERAEAERWDRLKAKIEAMTPAEPAPGVQLESAPDPQPHKRVSGRKWIAEVWARNEAAAALEGRKKRVQNHLIDHDVQGAEIPDLAETDAKQAQISHTVAPGTAAGDAVDVQVEAKCQIEDGE